MKPLRPLLLLPIILLALIIIGLHLHASKNRLAAPNGPKSLVSLTPEEAAIARLPEPLRQQIAFNLGKASARARSEAEQKFPISNLSSEGDLSQAFATKQKKANYALDDILFQRYVGAVCRHYQITMQQAAEINAEEAVKRWYGYKKIPSP